MQQGRRDVAQQRRFRIGEKVYSQLSMDEISLKDMLLFNIQVAELGLPYTWADVQRIAKELDGLSDAQAGQHPDIMFATAVTIWISRRGAGEDLSFDEAISIPMSAITFVSEPKDHQAGKAKGAKTSAPRKASGQAGAAAARRTQQS